MADTVFEYPDDKPVRGYISFTRFWKKGEDWVQITLISEDIHSLEIHTYASLPFKKFQEAFVATAKNIEETKDAWWHKVKKS